jgi:tRNA threonylcarbamoyladenosine biosynthesis protein TsaB
MKILAVETSSVMGSVALLEEDRILVEISMRLERQHSTNLVPLIERLLQTAGIGLAGIDGYAVGAGPGSFTGIRVGVTTVKGFALVTRKPVVAVSSLLALACDGLSGPYPAAPMVDAKRNLVYFGWYRCGKNGKPIQIIPPGLGTIEEALTKIKKPTLFIGDGAHCYRKQIQRLQGKKAHFPPTNDYFPRASSIGKMALEKFRLGKLDDPETLTPTYLYSRYCSIQGSR